MQRLSTVLWILLTTSSVHAQPADHQPQQVLPSKPEPRPAQELQLQQEPPREAPPVGVNSGPSLVMPQPAEAPASETRKLVAISLLSSGAGALGLGLIVGAGARSTYGEVKTLCGADLMCDTPTTFERGQHLVGIARLQAAISTVSIAAGSAAVVTGLVVWLTAPAERHRELTHVVPVVSTKDVALTVTGRF